MEEEDVWDRILAFPKMLRQHTVSKQTVTDSLIHNYMRIWAVALPTP